MSVLPYGEAPFRGECPLPADVLFGETVPGVDSRRPWPEPVQPPGPSGSGSSCTSPPIGRRRFWDRKLGPNALPRLGLAML